MQCEYKTRDNGGIFVTECNMLNKSSLFSCNSWRIIYTYGVAHHVGAQMFLRYHSDAYQIPPRCYSDGAQMTLRWRSDGTQMVLKWRSDGAQMQCEYKTRDNGGIFVTECNMLNKSSLFSRNSWRVIYTYGVTDMKYSVYRKVASTNTLLCLQTLPK